MSSGVFAGLVLLSGYATLACWYWQRRAKLAEERLARLEAKESL